MNQRSDPHAVAYAQIILMDPDSWADLGEIADHLVAGGFDDSNGQVYEDVSLGADFYRRCELLHGNRRPADFQDFPAIDRCLMRAHACGTAIRQIARDMRRLDGRQRPRRREILTDCLQSHGSRLQDLAPACFTDVHQLRITANLACEVIADRIDAFRHVTMAAAWLSIAFDARHANMICDPVPPPGLPYIRRLVPQL